MSYVHRIVALVSGILLYPVSFYVLHAIEIQTNYPELRPAIISVETALFSLAWWWITIRWLARPSRPAVWWCLGGLVLGFICWPLCSAIQDYYTTLHFETESGLVLKDIPRTGEPVKLPGPMPGLYFPPSWFYPNQLWRSIQAYLSDFRYDLWWFALFLLPFISGFAAAAAMVLRSERIAVRHA